MHLLSSSLCKASSDPAAPRSPAPPPPVSSNPFPKPQLTEASQDRPVLLPQLSPRSDPFPTNSLNPADCCLPPSTSAPCRSQILPHTPTDTLIFLSQ